MRIFQVAFIALLLPAILCCAKSAPTACDGISGACVAFAPGAAESDISAAFVNAKPNSTIAFAAGTYKFTNSLNLAHVAGVTIRGASSDNLGTNLVTVLDFSTVTGSGEGIVADTTDMVLFTDFIARDTKGNGIKVINSNGVTWRRVKTLWTNPDGHTHGAYGIYPVQSHNVLIENCEIAGAADAGVYVGQSDHIIVRNNDVHDNVAGIEIENSSYADVHDNTARGNVGGILVFNMPDLAINEGGWNHVFHNTIYANDTVNFARRGSSVARVPGGTGAFVLGGHDIEVDHNTFTGNNAAAFSIVSYEITGDPRIASCATASPLDYGYCAKMWPAKVFVHDNSFDSNGKNPVSALPTDCPDPTVASPAADCPDPVAFQLGQMLQATAQYVTNTSAVAPLVYDGITAPGATPDTFGGSSNDLMNVCYSNNSGAGAFVNLHFDVSGPDFANGNAGSALGAMTTDDAPFHCTLSALPAITVNAP
jgi:parallel beta-helix repeat protein